MKKLFVFAVLHFLGVSLVAQTVPLTQFGLFELGRVDIDPDELPEIVYQLGVSSLQPNTETYSVNTRIVSSNNASLFRARPNRTAFEAGESIGVSSMVLVSEIYLSAFAEELVFPTWFYFDRAHRLPDPFFTNKTSVLIGFQAQLEDSKHYGWLQFDRSSTAFTNFFQLTKWDWNPIPDATIRAGFPPEIPLNTELVSDGAETVLRLSWPGAAANWILETTTNLTAPIEWETYPTGGPSVDVPVGEVTDPVRYFRLRQP
ncbi:MAG: hypothetical protein J0M24_27715 [Verrucomicrobia bacterium]|nr:hypothetical protein [Verrucomicrobiota bacterium]